MNPRISEFSYGYAVTDELIHGHGTPISAAPVFPSLYQEGQEGGGYDVAISGPSLPLFIQFKLSHCLTTGNAAEARSGHLAVPYYRMHLRPLKHSIQHQLLLDLEAAGNDVYYCAPGFHLEGEFDLAYLNQQVCDLSVWIAPSEIGSLPDSGPHYIAFQRPTDGYFYICSNPTLVEAEISFQRVFQHLSTKLGKTEIETDKSFDFNGLELQLLELAAHRGVLPDLYFGDSRINSLNSIQRVAVIANVLLDAQLFLARSIK